MLRSTSPRYPAVLDDILMLGLWRQMRPGAAPRDAVAAATETVELVLGADSPLPENDQDVADLVQRLRWHVTQLAPTTLPGPAVERACEISETGAPEGELASRDYLRQLAIATQALVAGYRPRPCPRDGDRGVPRGRGRRAWRLSRNGARGVVFGLAVTFLIIASSIPRQ